MINNENEILKKIPDTLNKFKTTTPLTQCITNFVTVNDCANAILALGGSPIMADDPQEVEEIVNIANALVINIGTVRKEQIEAMKLSSAQANKTNTPITIDPVGVGISKVRNDTTLDLIENYDVAAIRGNITEIKTISKLINIIDDTNTAKGVDVCDDDVITEENLKLNGEIIAKTAEKLNTVILASGPIDILSDGKTTIAIYGGDEMMPLITGSGCMLSSLVGSCAGAVDPFNGTLLAILAMNKAGEKARAKVDENNLGTGSFRTFLIDALYQTDAEELVNESKIRIL
ncbi:hydroxyethylthiazole kinase [Methanobrevibacter millerae]|uniref:Hydroxyethylthiazole kinase n=1 Tax=Methanobrevibacter millerae TaxID=230361 RepID=A0A0U2L701_9EURY|nr:hydroxyethylthiazole kinase [Methanobrevibacter millerae]ALT69630.1 hydroxyethylthiazole kinase ThiM [Methanobrevibacter millerae]